jgi:hypothetical protein
MTLTPAQRRELSSLIGEYQTLLESTVNALIVPGTNEAMPGQVEDARQLKRARRMNAACERWQTRLAEGSTDAD